jgi:hypothetical protein
MALIHVDRQVTPSTSRKARQVSLAGLVRSVLLFEYGRERLYTARNNPVLRYPSERLPPG